MVNQKEIFEQVVCPVCNNEDGTKKTDFSYASNEALNIIGYKNDAPNVELIKCNNCQHHYANPQIKSEVLDLYYSNQNSEFYAEDRLIKRDPLEKKHRIIKNKIELIKPSGSIMEIGCGEGYLLSYFDNNKWAKVGVEPSPLAAKTAETLISGKIINDFLTKKTLTEKFDVIMLFDVIEHLKSPKDLFQIIQHYLKPDGLLVVGTANIRSFSPWFAGKWWGYFGSWEHVSFFSDKSISYFLNQLDFEVLNIIKTSYKGSKLDNLSKQIFFNTPAKMFNVFPFLLKLIPKKMKSKNVYHRGAFDHMIVFSSPKV